MIGKINRVYFTLVSFLLYVKVTIAQEPTLTLMPEIIRKNLGESVFVSCTASVPNQDLVTNMMWRGPNDLEIPTEDESVTTLEGIGSANQLDLFIKKLRMEDVGNYTCHATYAGNQRLTKTIKVEYYRDIDFKDTEKLQTPVLHSDAKIRCVVTSDPPPLVDWSKNGAPIKTSNRIIQQNDGILIKRITVEDEGVYKCRARVQALGEIKFIDIQVEVHIPPEITGAPKDTSGVEKESVAFVCIATGKPAPTYTWVNKDSEVLNKKEGYFVDELTGELRILDLRPDHAGRYRCTAKNAAGEAFAEAQLRVLMKPKIEQLLNITRPENEDAELRCVVSGDPLPHVIFQKETQHEHYVNGINENERIEVRQETNDLGQRVGVLRISDLARMDDGLYTCTGNSSGGVTVAWGHITVEFKPTFEHQPQNEFWSWEQKPVNLTCLATSIPNATISWYLREQPIRKEDPNLEVLSLGPNGVLSVHPLDGSYFDTYTCQASNQIGVTDHDVVLRQVQKPGPVSSAQVEKKTATTISWSIRDPLNDGGRPVLGFTVEYRLADTSWEKSEQKYWSKGSTYVIDNLTPLAKYVFRFAAKNDVGDGEWSGEKSVEMPKRAPPEEPLIYNVEDPKGYKEIPYTDHYSLQWQIPLDNGEKITEFAINYYQVVEAKPGAKAVGKSQEVTVPYPGPSTYKLENLHSNTLYKIELRARNNLGFSTPAEAFIQTAYDPSSPSGGKHGPSGMFSSISSPSPSNAVVEPPIADDKNAHSGIIVAIIIIVLLIVLVIIDVVLFFAKNVGVTAFIVSRLGTKQSEKDKEAMIEEGNNKSAKPDDNSNKEVDKVAVLKETSTDKEKEKEKEKECNETTPMITGLSRRSPFNSSIRRYRPETKSLFNIFANDSDDETEIDANNRFYQNFSSVRTSKEPLTSINAYLAKEMFSKSSPNFFGEASDSSLVESDLEAPRKFPMSFAPMVPPEKPTPIVPARKPTNIFRPYFLKDVYYYGNETDSVITKEKQQTAFLVAPYDYRQDINELGNNINSRQEHGYDYKIETAFKVAPYLPSSKNDNGPPKQMPVNFKHAHPIENNNNNYCQELRYDDYKIKTAFKVAPYLSSPKDTNRPPIRTPVNFPNDHPIESSYLLATPTSYPEKQPRTPAEYRKPPPITRSTKLLYKNISPSARSEHGMLPSESNIAYHIAPYHRNCNTFNMWTEDGSSSSSIESRENFLPNLDGNYERNFLNNSIRILRHSVSHLDNIRSNNGRNGNNESARFHSISTACSLGNLLHDPSPTRRYTQPTPI